MLFRSVTRLGASVSYVSMTYFVTPGSGPVQPGGVVDLVYNGSVIATGTLRLVNGHEQVTFHFTVTGHGTFAVSAQYRGSTAFAPSASPPAYVTG